MASKNEIIFNPRTGQKNGIPDIFQTSLICLVFNKEIRLVNPPWIIQKIVYSICAPLGRIAGYKPVYHPKKSPNSQNLNHQFL